MRRTSPPWFVLALLTTLALLRPDVSAAHAGDPADYPEYPYPTTSEGAYDEPYRGQFHFSSRGGWMNDVNAPLYYRGTYHLFYQHNPHGLNWDTMHWGHATSPDLVHWTQLPIALEPGVHPGDLWSGAGVVDTANTSGLKTGTDDPIVVFTGTNGVSVAYSTDGARTFTSFDGGRKVATPGGESRDPKVFWHAATRRWVMAVWSNEGGNGVSIYTSPDLLRWTYASRFTAPWLFECPDMFPLPLDGGGTVKWVLSDAGLEYVVGAFDGTTFTTTWAGPQRMDYGANNPGGTMYAALTFGNMPGGRIVQMAWQPGNRGATWTGNASFAAELGLRTYPEGMRVVRNPVAEIATIRADHRTWAGRTITAAPASNPLAGIAGDTYEVTAVFDTATATASEFGLRLHTRADGTYERQVAYDRAAQTLYGAPLAPSGGRVKVRALVDRGQLEIFGNDGRLSYSDNVNFRGSPAAQGISVYATGGSVRLVSLEYNRLQRIWPPSTPGVNPGSNIAGPWHPVGGTWTSVADGKTGTASGDAFYLSGQTGSDFTYEADLRPDTAGSAAALTFRASADLATHYTANVDTHGLVRLWRPGAILGDHPTTITPGTTYHLKVVTQGPRIRVYLGTTPTPVLDVTDTTTLSGYFALNTFNGTTTIRHTTVS
ncbi:GH32 C-terminal domain-containing protein [Sphaerisporangium corydalis]|uniref:GH32 C-terminal domain-containing protein n=1 Tax=Sphaerisporangium corydalis TaxID=1441875 RepID=A0ABV9EK24_9ACTN|nr:glycoside hydrolase family 32 protein [Sphaerisporangium corydalis]